MEKAGLFVPGEDHATRSKPRTARRLDAGLIAATLVVAMIAQGSVAVGAPERGGIRLVGGITLKDKDGKPINPSSVTSLLGIDPQLRMLVTIPDNENRMHLVNLDSLQDVGAISVPGWGQAHPLSPGLRSDTGGFDLDPRTHTAYLSDVDPQTGVLRILAVSLTRSFPDRTALLPAEFSLEGITGFGYDAPSDKLYVTSSLDQNATYLTGSTGGISRTGHPMTVHQVDARKLRSGQSPVLDWSFRIPGCTGQTSLTAGRDKPGFVARSRVGNLLYFACEGASESFRTGSQVSESGVVSIDIKSNDPAQFRTEFFPFGARLEQGVMQGDTTSHTIYVTDTQQRKMWIFDAVHRAWVGSIPYPEGAAKGMGFDPETGRFYFATLPRLLVSEGRSLPVPQGSQYEWPNGSELRVPGRLLFDPVRRHLFVAGPLTRTTPEGQQKPVVDGNLVVFRDEIPPVRRGQIANPDLATHDLEEVPGKTVSAYAVHAAAFGLRYHFAGGLRGLISKTFGGEDLNNEQAQFQFPLNQGSRDVFLGRVVETDLDSSGAVALAASTTLDGGTASDVAQVENPEPPDPAPQEAKEAFKEALAALQDTDPYKQARGLVDERVTPAACQDFGSEAADESAFGSQVSCDLERSSVRASAISDPSMESSPIQIGYAASSVELVRDPLRGAVARATAFARGVNILNLIHIGFVQQVVDTAAHGRPGTAASKVTTVMKQVRLTDDAGTELFACGFGEASCDPLIVARAINRFFTPRIHAESPPRNMDSLVAGSPGGAQAAVIKDPYRFWNDVNVNEDAQHEVPALQITIFHDTTRPSREILQLAAVEADAHYAIAPAPTGGSFPMNPITDVIDGLKPIGTLGPDAGTVVDTEAPQPAAGSGGSPIKRIVRGISFLLQSPKDALLLTLAWALLFCPVYLLVRRFRMVRETKRLGGIIG